MFMVIYSLPVESKPDVGKVNRLFGNKNALPAQWVNHCATMGATRVPFPEEVIPTDLPITTRC